jgi:UDP-GlcNAc:undecaprenyl-phosphate/decaprenyl-phosphate GlcNAc-1-phosphate transferase
MAAALLGALIAFLRYNLSEGSQKIFMGDSGSLVIGFTLAVLAVRFNELVASGGAVLDLKSAPAVSIGILIIPLFDTLRVMTLRLLDKKSMFIGDKRHIHHLMLRTGMSHRQATLFISLFNVSMIVVAFLLDSLGILLLGFVLLGLCLIATQILILAVRKRESGEPDIVSVQDVTEVNKAG